MAFPTNPSDGDLYNIESRQFIYNADIGAWRSHSTIATHITSYATTDDLPADLHNPGAVAFVLQTRNLYIWSGSSWNKVGTYTE